LLSYSSVDARGSASGLNLCDARNEEPAPSNRRRRLLARAASHWR
jgi:hypothetical protein